MSCDSGPVKAIREASPQALHHFSLDFSSAQVGLVGLGVPWLVHLPGLIFLFLVDGVQTGNSRSRVAARNHRRVDPTVIKVNPRIGGMGRSRRDSTEGCVKQGGAG